MGAFCRARVAGKFRIHSVSLNLILSEESFGIMFALSLETFYRKHLISPLPTKI